MTLKDVALKANCSVSTASKALKNSSEISEEAKQRILDVAIECGYFKKATTRTAVLGGFKTVIFNDIKGDGVNLYFELQKLAKKYSLTLLYVSISEKDSLELLNQLGAFGLILRGENVKSIGEKIFVLKGVSDEAKEFLNEISNFMPQRPSRAVKKKKEKVVTTKNNVKTKKKSEPKTDFKKEKSEKPAAKKEEIWLL